MSANPKHLYTLEEYFALEKTGDARYEYWNGEIVCMSGGSEDHGQICGNIYYYLRAGLSGRECRVFTGDIAIKTPVLPPYRYPDVSVVCGQAQFESINGIDVLVNPTILVEVLSTYSETRDKKAKLNLYMPIDSLQQYLIVAQDKPVVIVNRRQPDNSWQEANIEGLGAYIELPSIGCVLEFTAIYEAVTFDR
ncbi:MAG: Uma2 family endonuclease [Acidobacteriota bacterium]